MNKPEERVFGAGLPKSWVVVGRRRSPRRKTKFSWTFRVTLAFRKLFHIEHFRNRDKPPRFPVNSWRWLLFSRWVPVRSANSHVIQMHGKTVQPGGIVDYMKMSFWYCISGKFPKTHQFFRKRTLKRMPCGCHRHIWSRQPSLMNGDCEIHGLVSLLGELKHPTDKYVAPDD